MIPHTYFRCETQHTPTWVGGHYKPHIYLPSPCEESEHHINPCFHPHKKVTSRYSAPRPHGDVYGILFVGWGLLHATRNTENKYNIDGENSINLYHENRRKKRGKIKKGYKVVFHDP